MANPGACLRSNVMASATVFEAAARHSIDRVIYASSSSVYGANAGVCREDDHDIAPLSLYGASERSVEVLARSHWESRGLRTVGARLFTAYGAWSRPDMAYFRLLVSAFTGAPFPLLADLDACRDIAYISDTVSVLVGHLERAPEFADPAMLINVGGGEPTTLLSLLRTVEDATGRKVNVQWGGDTPGDVLHTEAPTERLQALNLPLPQTSLRSGIERTAAWLAPIVANARRWVDAA
jgi:UDP-glucuronate 4-epimerase